MQQATNYSLVTAFLLLMENTYYHYDTMMNWKCGFILLERLIMRLRDLEVYFLFTILPQSLSRKYANLQFDIDNLSKIEVSVFVRKKTRYAILYDFTGMNFNFHIQFLQIFYSFPYAIYYIM